MVVLYSWYQITCCLFYLTCFWYLLMLIQAALVYSLKLLYSTVSEQEIIICFSVDQHRNHFSFFSFRNWFCSQHLYISFLYMCKSISKYTPGSEMWGLRAFPSFLILHNCSTILKKTFLSLKKKKNNDYYGAPTICQYEAGNKSDKNLCCLWSYILMEGEQVN